MNKRKIIRTLGYIILTLGFLMIPSLIVSAIYQDGDSFEIGSTIAGTLVLGFLMSRVKAPEMKMRSRDGYTIVALAWLIICLIGAIPMYLSSVFESYIGAFFEMVSGFTTTGASVLSNPEYLPHGVGFWRCFSHWVGGMGVLVFVMMVAPMNNENSMHLVKAEVPGPTAGKLVPRMKETSMINYGIYAFLTLMCFILLLIGKVPVYDALCLSFGTAGTGGFSPSSVGFAAYNSYYVEMVVSVFMILFGVNFNVYFLILIKKVKDAFRIEEVWWYFGFIAFSTITIMANIMHTLPSAGQAFRYSFFQVASIITTTGFATVDFNQWPEYSKHVLILLMIVGACSGSTGGGMKVCRVVMVVKSFFTELKHIMDPRHISIVRLDGKKVEKETLIATRVYVCTYFLIICIVTLLISLNNQDFTTNLTAVLSCFNNIGPGFSAIGPMSNFSVYDDWVQLLLSLTMLTGRLEIFPMFMIFSRSSHEKRLSL